MAGIVKIQKGDIHRATTNDLVFHERRIQLHDVESDLRDCRDGQISSVNSEKVTYYTGCTAILAA